MKRVFILFFIATMTFSLVACGGSSDNRVPVEKPEQEERAKDEQDQSTKDSSSEENSSENPVSEQSKVDLFIEEYNKTAENQITDAIEVDVTDKESGHYRTEFRLNAYSKSCAKTGKIGDITIDIVCYGRDNEDIRVYADEIDLEQAKEIVK